MSTATSFNGILSSSETKPSRQTLTAIEILIVYSCVLFHIWRWQFTHPRTWMLLWGAIILSHIAHRDSLRALGLTIAGLRPSAEVILPLAAVVYTPLLAYGFARHNLAFIAPGKSTLFSFAGYAAWCAFQQYLAQSYFHHRLMSVIRNSHLSSLLVALMFGAAHIPNPILMVSTTLGGFLLSEVFARHRNIWPLALAQAVGGFLIAALSPASLIHNMRVGPGYLFYHL
jgi:hypothetical protein